MSKPEEFANWPEALQVLWEYRAVVKRIVDGDTLYVLFDLGLNQYAYESIRLAGVQAPELFSGNFRDQGAEAKAQLESICGPGTQVKVYTDKDHETFGRYVGTLKTASGLFVNVLMNLWLQEKGYDLGS